MAGSRPVAVLGGTFDPIHNAHLRTALELLDTLDLAEVRFVPVGQPPHRDPPAVSADRRLAMVKLAIAGQPGFVADDRELRRPGPSYMVETLESLRAELGDDIPLCLVLGTDAFDHLHRWHRWQALPELAHLVVVHRPGAAMPLAEALGELLLERKLHHPEDLGRRPAGGVLLHPVTQLDIAATAIREGLARGLSPRYLLPESVLDYIRQHGLYRS